MNIDIKVDTKKIQNKVRNDNFGLFVAQKWKLLLDPYTPRDTGKLMDIYGNGETVKIKPFDIDYKQEYAPYVYNGVYMNFQKKNPYSTHHWDKAAERAGKKSILYREINDKLKKKKF